ncbi:MAG: copper chaperone PCu(A)C [Pseudomonadota bacterium]
MNKTILVAALIAASTKMALADSIQVGDITIMNPVARATPVNAPVSAGYMTITNNGVQADRLISVETNFSARGEIHEMAMDGDVMKMRELESGIELPAGESVTLMPGGLHLMFMGLSEQLLEGETRDVTIIFENAGSVDLTLDVQSLATIRENMSGGMEMKDHSGHDHSHGHSHKTQ